jgi:D-3-phosphoglycerate dehydrogenase
MKYKLNWQNMYADTLIKFDDRGGCMFKVLIPQDIDESGKEFLRKNGYEVIIGSGSDAETIKREVVDCDALVVRTAPYTKDVISAGRKLKVIARFGVGTDNIDVRAAEEQGIYVTITRDVNAVSVAEHAIALMLGCAKKLVYFDKETRNGSWDLRNMIPTVELSWKTLGIIGLGAIGLETARKAHFGFDMKIISFARNRNKKSIPDYIELVDSVDDIFRNSDVVSLHVPRTKDTENLVNKTKFALMKPSSILVNTARGGIINEDDLYDALVNFKIACAACDVFDIEPPEKENKLLTLDNFIVSPHNAGLTTEAKIKMGLSAAKSVHDVLCGRKPDHPINNPKI